MSERPRKIESTGGGDAEAAMEAAAAAQAAANNARQMVLNRDPRLTSLEGIAAAYTEDKAASVAEHARLQKAIDDKAMTPGPPGPASTVPGPSGITPRLTIGTVSTLAAGQSATATFTGTATDPVLNLGIPRGAAGTAGSVTAQAIGTGRIAVAVLLGASTDVVVALSRTMPSTTYTVDIAPTAGMTFTVISQTTTTVTVRVTAALALAIGATFQLVARI